MLKEMARLKLPNGSMMVSDIRVQWIEFAIHHMTAILIKFVLATCGNTTTNKKPVEVAGIIRSAKTDLSTCLTEE